MTHKCIFALRKECIVVERVKSVESEYGSTKFVQLYCGMCVKSMYARAKHRLINRFSVVNTL